MSSEATDTETQEIPEHLTVPIAERDGEFTDEEREQCKADVLKQIEAFEQYAGAEINMEGSGQDTKDQLADLIVSTVDKLDVFESLVFGGIIATAAQNQMAAQQSGDLERLIAEAQAEADAEDDAIEGEAVEPEADDGSEN